MYVCSKRICDMWLLGNKSISIFFFLLFMFVLQAGTYNIFQIWTTNRSASCGTSRHNTCTCGWRRQTTKLSNSSRRSNRPSCITCFLRAARPTPTCTWAWYGRCHVNLTVVSVACLGKHSPPNKLFLTLSNTIVDGIISLVVIYKNMAYH